MKIFKRVKRVFGAVYTWLICNAAFAENYIPTSSDDQAKSGESFAETIGRIFVNDVIPVIELVGSAILIVYGVKTIIGTVQDYRKEKEFGVLLEGIAVLAIIFAIGAGVFYLFDYLTQKYGAQ